MKTAETADNAAELLSAKENLVGLPKAELGARLVALGIEPFRAKQIWQWIYTQGVRDFSAMTNIAKPTRELLAQHFTIERAGISRNAVSFDETRKWLLKFADGNEVETVFIPDAKRGTLCVSSQVGCTLACTFCHTGTQRLVRNLTASEIVTQLMIARDDLGEWPSSSSTCKGEDRGGGQGVPTKSGGATRNSADPHPTLPLSGGGNNAHRLVTNIVFMGMGEPLLNYDHVVAACRIMLDPDGLALSRRRITVSTSGYVPKIRPLATDAGVNLAISLHAVTDELRDQIVPINRKYPIVELLAACRDYVKVVKDRRIMFEYVMLKGINDSDADARQLVKLLEGIPAKVNLIPFNPWPGAPYECSSNNRIHSFGRIVMAAGIASPIRKTRGEDIMAACGQLKSLSELKKGQKVKLK
ncbi:MAG: 23S rRNA (adenine(2503)-C(2))-methyltransferase RlmN [Alphaproteobacteria bacterium]